MHTHVSAQNNCYCKMHSASCLQLNDVDAVNSFPEE